VTDMTGKSKFHFRLSHIFDVFLYLFMAVFTLSILVPFWDIIITSISLRPTALGVNWWPKEYSFSSYETIFNSNVVFIGYRTTILRTIVGVALNVFTTFCAAYPLSKKHMPLRKTILLFIMATMFFQGGLIPHFLNVKALGLMDTFWALVIPSSASAMSIFLCKNFLQSLPDALEESAEIDGANSITILVKIILPLSMPILAVVALWAAVGFWNEWFYAMVFVRNPDLEVLQMLLRRVTRLVSGSTNTVFPAIPGGLVRPSTASMIAATIVITMGPIVLVYPFIQKYFVKGIMVGSLKG